MLVMGIDPGTAITGYALVHDDAGELVLITCGIITTTADQPMPDRLVTIHGELTELIDRYRPQSVAVEQLFFSRNVRTALAVGQARGVVLLAAAHRALPVSEYTPLQVKQAVVGYGRAEKSRTAAAEARLDTSAGRRRRRRGRGRVPPPLCAPAGVAGGSRTER